MKSGFCLFPDIILVIPSNTEYTTGTMTKVRNNDEISPPMITQANPLFISAAAPVAMAIGTIPNTMAIVVIKIGRNLAWLAWIRAVLTVSPAARLWLVKSTIRMAFLATSPMSIIIPRIVKMLIELLVNAKIIITPIKASGMENKTTNGWT